MFDAPVSSPYAIPRLCVETASQFSICLKVTAIRDNERFEQLGTKCASNLELVFDKCCQWTLFSLAGIARKTTDLYRAANK